MILIKLGWAVFAPKDRKNFIDETYLKKFSDFFKTQIQQSSILLHWTWNIGHWFVKQHGLTPTNQHILRQNLDRLFEITDKHIHGHKRIHATDILAGQHDEDVYTISWWDIDNHQNIISSDDTFSYYIHQDHIQAWFMLTDTHGVLDIDNQIIKTITAENLSTLKFRKKTTDVTGSMQNKIIKLFKTKKNWAKKKTVRIINWYDLQNFKNILTNQKGIGTQVII